MQKRRPTNYEPKAMDVKHYSLKLRIDLTQIHFRNRFDFVFIKKQCDVF